MTSQGTPTKHLMKLVLGIGFDIENSPDTDDINSVSDTQRLCGTERGQL